MVVPPPAPAWAAVAAAALAQSVRTRGLPLLLGGLRSATLQVVATATLAAYVNLGGLGFDIIQGLPLRRYDQMLGAALLVVALAFAPHGRSYASGGEDGYVRITHFPEVYFDAFSKKTAEAFDRPWPEKK